VYHSIDDEEVEEGLDANQKRAGQLGPTGGPAKVGDLVGANESTEFTDELSRIIDISRFNR
jgi:FKBP-type peptidyl-prolyl cis-trans isomerase (trigger factor)